MLNRHSRKAELTCSSAERPANRSLKRGCEKPLATPVEIWPENFSELLKSLNQSGLFGRMLPESFRLTEDSPLGNLPVKFKNSGMGSRGGFLTLNTSEFLNDAVESSLSDIAETGVVPQEFYLSRKCCKGILRRMRERKKSAPKLEAALKKAIG